LNSAVQLGNFPARKLASPDTWESFVEDFRNVQQPLPQAWGDLFGPLRTELGRQITAWSAARIDVFPERHGLLLVLLPPGAFILLGLMLAARNRAAQRRQVRRSSAIAVGNSRA